MPVWIVGTSDLNRSGNSLASPRAIGSGALWLPTKTNRNIPQDGTNKLPFQYLPDRRNSPSCLSRKGSDLNSSNIEAVFDSSDCAPCRQGGARIKKHSLGVNRTSAIADEISRLHLSNARFSGANRNGTSAGLQRDDRKRTPVFGWTIGRL